MDDVWYKDPRTGRLYQDRKERGETVRYWRDAPRESSTIRQEASSSRRDQPAHRSRRDSVISSGSVDTRPSRIQTQRPTSSKKASSTRQEDGGRKTERSDTTYKSDSRDYTRQDEQQVAYGDGQTHSSYRDAERQPGEYSSQRKYDVSGAADSMGNLTGQMRTLSTGGDYTQQNVSSSLPAVTGYTDSAVYGTSRLENPSIDHGKSLAKSADLPPTQTVPASRHVKGTPGDAEKLDKSYQIRNHDYKKFFRVGRVFSTLWTEGVGNNIENINQTFVSEIVYKEKVYSKVRRFVVVRVSDRSVTCLPVTSYDGAGHKKGGIRLEDHGFIHSKNPPKKVDQMLSKSLKVVLSRGAAHIKDPSLVNYGKVYNVETNVKVKDIGDLDPDSRAVLVRYFRRVFVEDGDLPTSIDDTPRQANAVLAHVGGAAHNLPPSSGYSAASTSGYPRPPSYLPAAGHDMTSSYATSAYTAQPSAGYPNTPESRLATYDSAGYRSTGAGTGYSTSSYMQAPRESEEPNYPPQPGTGYPVASMNSGYISTTSYGPAAISSSRYNTTPNYYAPAPVYPSSETRYDSVPSGPPGTTSYGTNYPVSYAQQTYPSDNMAPRSFNQQGGGGQISSGGTDYYAGQQSRQPSYQAAPVDDGDEEIKLTTLEEESRRRRDSNAGPSRSDRRRRR